MKPTAEHSKSDESKPGSKPDAKDDLKTLPMAEVEKKLNSSPDGLTDAEAKKRLTQYGPNEIEEKKTNPLLKFLTYFWGPIPWMIEVAVILSGVVRHWPDFFIILLLLFANAVVGFWEERQAGNAIDALKAKLAIKARVKRDGKWISVAAGLATILEHTYQSGDWIEVDGTYGEVKSIGVRAVHLLTADDTEVIVPHSRLWSASIHNASSGSRSLLCVTDFYLHPDHDAALIRQQLEEIAESNSYRKPGTGVTVIVLEKPWGTHYRVKAYVKESREQFLFISDVTVRGKEALRHAGIQFAQATYAETAKS
jgi:hypothetical protein